MIDILLVGYGAMGRALHHGWQTDEALRVTVVDPVAPGEYTDPADLPRDYQPAIIVFSVKPQVLSSVLPLYKAFVNPQTLFISIAAGFSFAQLQAGLEGAARLVRAMPNLPATVKQGMTGLVSVLPLTYAEQSTVMQLFETVGAAIWVHSEAALDLVTAVSGSGPAYFFKMTECLENAAVTAGLAPDMAALLARQTAIGAGALLRGTTEPATLWRERVTSPGGTTEAALRIFDTALQTLCTHAVQAAFDRAQELKKPS